MAVFSIDSRSGEPNLLQQIDPRGAHPRTFSIDASGHILLAASLGPMALSDGSQNHVLPARQAGLSVFRIGEDGKLKFERRYDGETEGKTQFWSGMVQLA